MKKIFKTILIVLSIALLVSCTSLYNDLLKEYGPSNLEIIKKPTSTTAATTAATSSSLTDNNTNDPQDDPQDDPAETTFSAPDFTVIDMNGNQVKLSSFAGKPIVINFWATWCGYCKQEMPDFQALYKKYPDVQFVMVNANDTVSNGKSYISQSGYTFPVFFDTTGEAAIAYGVDAFPYTFFIDASGELTAYGRGMLSYENIEKGISMITGE